MTPKTLSQTVGAQAPAALPTFTHAIAGLLPAFLLAAGMGTAVAPALAQVPVQLSAGQAQAQAVDPPGRVAWLNLVDGEVSLATSEADSAAQNQWTPAQLNRPITTGDRLWTGRNARSELHIGSMAVRMDGETSLDLAQLDDDTTSLHLAQGTINLRVRALFEDQRLEIRTPNLAFVVQQPGEYRLDVIPSGNVTRVVVLSGAGQVYGESGVPFALGDRQQSSFTGTRLAQVMLPGALQADTFDAWAADRNRQEDQSVSARYVPREVTGYQQLDAYGDWSEDPAYGAVWFPRAMPANWAPYSAGRWDWISPWGWTWIDDAPWGFAPFHYGRWTQVGPRWAWAPGRLAPRPVYAPALVGFIGGGSGGTSWNISIGGGRGPGPGFGWFPLAPGEAFRPHYRGSPRYVSRLNNNIAINNNFSNYRFQRMLGAVTAVGADDFRRGRHVRGSGFVSAEDLRRAQIVDGNRGLPQRAGPRDARDNPRPPAGAAPPPGIANRPNDFSGGRDSGRNDRGPRPDGRPDGRPDRPDRPAGGILSTGPQSTAPASPTSPAMQAGPGNRPDRDGRDRGDGPNGRDQAERRARVEREQQPRQQQWPQAGIATPATGALGVPQTENPDPRTNRDRAGRPGFELSPPAPQRQLQQQQQLQQEQFRQQRDAQRLQDLQRRQNEESAQRAQRESQQREQDARRLQDQQQQQQQQFRDQAAQRSREQAMQGQARQAQERQRQFQLQQMQRAGQAEAQQRPSRPAGGTMSGGPARPEAATPRPPRPEGQQGQPRRQPPARSEPPAAP